MDDDFNEFIEHIYINLEVPRIVLRDMENILERFSNNELIHRYRFRRNVINNYCLLCILKAWHKLIEDYLYLLLLNYVPHFDFMRVAVIREYVGISSAFTKIYSSSYLTCCNCQKSTQLL
ncbi:hypothetical protein RN001_002123 [Aquatica leii]|uniref:Uncharacterized protein n=1 Tax=Aquatica leii TaxID=1421715 RepID=A0AAN7PGP0_9COLE|nr:hypothetical protein RN001_002123 [Aquatica leii]